MDFIKRLFGVKPANSMNSAPVIPNTGAAAPVLPASTNATATATVGGKRKNSRSRSRSRSSRRRHRKQTRRNRNHSRKNLRK